MSRKPGSGLYTVTATAVEELLAAHLRRDRQAQRHFEGAIDLQFTAGRSGVTGSAISNLLRGFADHIPYQIADARRLPQGRHADVVADLARGGGLSFEVKAQTTKSLDDLIQADWIRGDTDGLSSLVHGNPLVASAFSPGLRSRLGSRHVRSGPHPNPYLLAADLCLLTSADRKAEARSSNLVTLRAYAERKYLVHVAGDGIGAFNFARFPLIGRSLRGTMPNVRIEVLRESVAIRLAPSASADWEFSYYVYDRQLSLGRHKMHNRALPAADYSAAA